MKSSSPPSKSSGMLARRLLLKKKKTKRWHWSSFPSLPTQQDRFYIARWKRGFCKEKTQRICSPRGFCFWLNLRQLIASPAGRSSNDCLNLFRSVLLLQKLPVCCPTLFCPCLWERATRCLCFLLERQKILWRRPYDKFEARADC